ncbi:hypothetical protein OG203_22025 [Nocardia sp. NBC_01499]|uniref:hypothetical protein n=1 Tax=Nocardia sp. NBC_01499 TaxID=2903597 RepID=UPI00386EEBE8
MNESNGDQHRTRRRAVRSVGPPAEETASPSVTSVPAAQATTAAFEARVAALGSQQPGDAKSSAPSDVEKAAAATASAPETDATSATPTDPADGTSVDIAKAPTDSAESTSVDLAKAPTVSDETPDTDTEPARRGIWRTIAVAAAAVLVLALLIGAGFAGMKVRSIDARDARRTEYQQTARQAILNLTTIRADSAKADIDRILSVASGQFKNEFDGRVDPFMNIVQQAKVVSNGEIIDAALQSDDENSATVLVAAKQTLTNAGQQGEQTRYYRFRVTVSRGDSGMTVSKVEFVG